MFNMEHSYQKSISLTCLIVVATLRKNYYQQLAVIMVSVISSIRPLLPRMFKSIIWTFLTGITSSEDYIVSFDEVTEAYISKSVRC